MSWKNKSYIVFLILIFAFCKVKEELSSLPEFNLFYENFHKDSSFQLSHILFPLEGLPDQNDSLNEENFKWQKADWLLHRKFNEGDTAFIRSIQVVSPTLARETIIHKFTGMRMERRFAKLDTAWFLIYYSGMKQAVQIEIN